MQVTTIGLDLAKNVFQVHGIDATEKVVVRKQLRRGQVIAFFEALAPCLIGMEACATAHHAEFGRMCPQGIDQLSALAHQQIAYAMLHQTLRDGRTRCSLSILKMASAGWIPLFDRGAPLFRE